MCRESAEMDHLKDLDGLEDAECVPWKCQCPGLLLKAAGISTLTAIFARVRNQL